MFFKLLHERLFAKTFPEIAKKFCRVLGIYLVCVCFCFSASGSYIGCVPVGLVGSLSSEQGYLSLVLDITSLNFIAFIVLFVKWIFVTNKGSTKYATKCLFGSYEVRARLILLYLGPKTSYLGSLDRTGEAVLYCCALFVHQF